jgi:uncharacterized protein YndB with AHSA1/START domain
MTDLAVEREILIEAPADVVWRTITEPDQIARWFADRVQLDLRPGGDGTLVFEEKAAVHAATVPLVVETVDPPRRFSFRWGHPDGEAPAAGNSVLVEFTLSAESDERTRRRVVETGLDARPSPNTSPFSRTPASSPATEWGARSCSASTPTGSTRRHRRWRSWPATGTGGCRRSSGSPKRRTERGRTLRNDDDASPASVVPASADDQAASWNTRPSVRRWPERTTLTPWRIGARLQPRRPRTGRSRVVNTSPCPCGIAVAVARDWACGRCSTTTNSPPV